MNSNYSLMGKSALEGMPTSSPFKPANLLMDELKINNLIRLGANENPLGPSPKVIQAMINVLNDVHLYPDGNNTDLINRISEHTRLPKDFIVVEAGISGLLRVTLEAFIEPNDKVVFPWPSYAAYHHVVKVCGGIPVPIPLQDDLQTDFEAILVAAQQARIIILCNPNNPTGLSFSNDQIRWLANQLPSDCLLIIDEAYFEYSDNEGATSLINEGYPIIVMRTFSKAYGLAGLRIGYGLMSPSLAVWINRCREPIMVSTVSKAAAIAALDDEAYLQKSVQIISDGREKLRKTCSKLGIATVKSSSNFLLFRCGRHSREIESHLLSQGIMVRATDDLFQLEGGLRVTIGTPKMNNIFLKSFSNIINNYVKSTKK